MDTLIRIYLYFIGVIAVLICFITWVSIRLRAERINRIRIERERDEKYIEFTKSANAGIETIKLLQKDIEFIEKARDQAVDYANTLFKDLKGALEMNAKLMEATKGLEQPEWIHTDKIKVDFVELELPKPIRSVTSLTDKECIEVKNDEERDEILRLMDRIDGATWKGFNCKPSEFTPNFKYPYCLAIGFSKRNKLGYDSTHFYEDNNITIIPASDFIQPKKDEFKKGDYVYGKLHNDETEEAEGEIAEIRNLTVTVITPKGNLRTLALNTCKLIEQPKPTRDWSVPQAFPDEYIPTKKIKAVRVIDNNGHIQVGTKGVINPDGTSCPVFRYKNEPHSEMCSSIDKLAPINPLDHPEHPQFNKK